MAVLFAGNHIIEILNNFTKLQAKDLIGTFSSMIGSFFIIMPGILSDIIGVVLLIKYIQIMKSTKHSHSNQKQDTADYAPYDYTKHNGDIIDTQAFSKE